MKLSNDWNRFIYRLWAPIYDATVNRVFMPGRRRALEVLNVQPGERVLVVGVGTGEDLRLLPAGAEALGVDLSPEMLEKARSKLSRCAASVELMQGDAQAQMAPDATFDAAVLNLILAVIPDGNACLQASLRALKPGGRAVIFDKFLPDADQVTLWRRFLNFFSTLLGTDINRRLSDLVRGCPCRVVCSEPSIAGGFYQVVLIEKTYEQAGLRSQRLQKATSVRS